MPVPDHVKKEIFDVSFGFQNLVDAVNGRNFSGRVAVGPLFKMGESENPIMLVQME